MRPVLPVDVLDVDQAQKGFVDQFGRLHAVVRTLAVQAPAGDALQLVVDEWHQRIQSRLVSLAPGSEEHGHLVGRAQNACILTGFRVVSVSAVRFRLSVRERDVEADNGPDRDGGRSAPRPITTERRSSMTRLHPSVILVALLVCSPIAARADVVLDWNAIAVSTLVAQGQSPYAQSRFMAITQLAVFEAVNAITRDYKPYLGTVIAPLGASADAAAVAAAYQVLKTSFPLAASNLDAAYAASLAAIPDGSAKSGGIATGRAAAAQMIALRLNDGASPPQFYVPASTDPGVWQLTPSCPAAGGVNFQWQNMTPFGVRAFSAARHGSRGLPRVRPRRSPASDTQRTTTS